MSSESTQPHEQDESETVTRPIFPLHVAQSAFILPLYIGGALAAAGLEAGVFGSAFAGLAFAFFAFERNLTPAAPTWARIASVAIAVFAAAWAWYLFQNPLNNLTWRFVLPAIPPLIVAAYAFLPIVFTLKRR